MDYLDYLTDYDYDALPEAVRSTIGRGAYKQRREMALLMREEPDVDMPAVLQAAFVARTQGAKPVHNRNLRWLPWLAAAGWLLFLGVSSVLLLREPETLLVEKTIIAPAAEPQIITVTDTVFHTVTQVRYRTKHDTVFQQIPTSPKLVYVRDTLYLPPVKPILVKGSSNLSGKERVLDFLFSTE